MKENFMKEISMEINLKLKKIYFIIILFFFLSENLSSLENKIIFKIDNEIITHIDVENEKNYLIALNPNLKKLKYNEIIDVTKKSVVREKIKRIEISNRFKNAEIPQSLLEQLLKNIYTNIGLNNLEDFKKYLEINNVNYFTVLKKIETEALWNELIYSLYSKNVKIDEEKLREDILKNNAKKIKSYLMSEIFFEVSKSEKIQTKYKEIVNSINNNGFENTALKYSISATSNMGGKLDWINENSLNIKIRDVLAKKEVNEFTKPITVPGGFLILKINDIKTQKSEINLNTELKKLIQITRNNQLNQYSKIYFNKVKENMEINEI